MINTPNPGTHSLGTFSRAQRDSNLTKRLTKNFQNECKYPQLCKNLEDKIERFLP